jgi:hypothetical protein
MHCIRCVPSRPAAGVCDHESRPQADLSADCSAILDQFSVVLHNHRETTSNTLGLPSRTLAMHVDQETEQDAATRASGLLLVLEQLDHSKITPV